MKNKFLIIVIGISVMAALVSINLVAAYSSCVPEVKLVNQDPTPAVPGSYVKLVFEMSGLQNPICNGVAVKLETSYPFSLDPNATAIQTLEGNTYTQGYKSVWTIPYKLRVADDALDGDYQIRMLYRVGNGNIEDFESFAIEKDFNITITDSQTKFDAVIQDSTGSEVSIAIANVGKYTANSVVVRIPEQESFTVSGTDGQMVGNLDSGDYTIVGFTVSPKDMEMGLRNISRTTPPATSQGTSNKLKFDIYYTDNIGERRIVNMELSLDTKNSTMTGLGNFPGRKTTKNNSWSNWYTLIIIVALLSAAFIIYKKYPKQTRNFLNKIFKKKNSQSNASQKTPDWVRNSKEKEKKK